MNYCTVFVASGFTKENMRLQPWRYIYELAKHRTKKGKVFVITEGLYDRESIELDANITVINTRLYSVKNQLKLGELIESLSPDQVWWSTTQRTIAYYPLLSRLEVDIVAFITCPFYSWYQLLRAVMNSIPYHQVRDLLKQRMIPRPLFRSFMNSRIFRKIIVQSRSNLEILKKIGLNQDKLDVLPVGIDIEDVKPVSPDVLDSASRQLCRNEGEIVYLYLGALRPIRGFDFLINAFSLVSDKSDNTRLVVLARGMSDDDCGHLITDLENKGLMKRVQIIPGWLSREEVWSFIELSDIVVLPFVLVPSDVPIAALESLARNKPIMVSSVDGLPELAEGRGIVIDPLNAREFADQMLNMASNRVDLETYSLAAEDFIKKYPRWNDVGGIMDSIAI